VEMAARAESPVTLFAPSNRAIRQPPLEPICASCRSWGSAVNWRCWPATRCYPRLQDLRRRDRAAPIVEVRVSADQDRHRLQDLQSLALHEEAVRLAKLNPTLVQQASGTVTRWLATGDTRSVSLWREWVKIWIWCVAQGAGPNAARPATASSFAARYSVARRSASECLRADQQPQEGPCARQQPKPAHCRRSSDDARKLSERTRPSRRSPSGRMLEGGVHVPVIGGL